MKVAKIRQTNHCLVYGKNQQLPRTEENSSLWGQEIPIVDVGGGADDTPVVSYEQLGVDVDELSHWDSLQTTSSLYVCKSLHQVM